jgi:hypothetical protein
MGWNNMKSFSIPGSEAYQNERVWYDHHGTDVHGNGAHSVHQNTTIVRLHCMEIQNQFALLVHTPIISSSS